jgi:hypothetical protein
MRTRSGSEIISQDRRRLLGIAAMGIVVAGATNLPPTRLAAASKTEAIRPFKINIPKDQLVDLRRRLTLTRWPDRETVSNDLRAYSWPRCRSSLPTGAKWRRN